VDPIIAQLHALLEVSSTKRTDFNYASEEAEVISYEALQVAQSQVRKCAKAGNGNPNGVWSLPNTSFVNHKSYCIILIDC